MGLLRSLLMLVFLTWFYRLPDLEAQSSINSSSTMAARSLDSLLQDYAYRAFVRPKTGIPYDGSVPSNLTGIKITALRLRNGSLRKRGVRMYNEFKIPMEILVAPYVKRLVLVYQNLGNWSEVFYPLSGYVYLTPVVGMLAYNGTNLSATNLPELDIRASRDPITIVFSNVRSVPDGSASKCVRFDLRGSYVFSDLASGNTCSTIQQGHFSIVVESVAPAPAPSPKPRKPRSKTWIIVGSILGGLVLLILLLFMVLWLKKYKQKKKLQEMERAGETGEALRTTMVGNTRAPAATVTRTQPTLETEHVS